MFDHLSLPVTSIEKALPFYEALMNVLGHAFVGSNETWAGFGLRADSENPERVYLSLLKSEVALPAKCHIAFKASSRKQVNEAYKACLKAGGESDGECGVRPHYHAHYYAGFLKDVDGNRIEIVCHNRE